MTFRSQAPSDVGVGVGPLEVQQSIMRRPPQLLLLKQISRSEKHVQKRLIERITNLFEYTSNLIGGLTMRAATATELPRGPGESRE